MHQLFLCNTIHPYQEPQKSLLKTKRIPLIPINHIISLQLFSLPVLEYSYSKKPQFSSVVVTKMEEGRRNHGVYGQDNAYDMFINIKVERPNNR